jgi:hypothetical protein
VRLWPSASGSRSLGTSLERAPFCGARRVYAPVSEGNCLRISPPQPPDTRERLNQVRARGSLSSVSLPSKTYARKWPTQWRQVDVVRCWRPRWRWWSRWCRCSRPPIGHCNTSPDATGRDRSRGLWRSIRHYSWRRLRPLRCIAPPLRMSMRVCSLLDTRGGGRRRGWLGDRRSGRMLKQSEA